MCGSIRSLLDTNYLSTNLQICRRNWQGYLLILYLQSQMVRLDTIKHLLIQQMLNCKNFSVLASWLCTITSKKPTIRGKCVTLLSAAIREHQVQPKLFLWEQRTGSFSIQSVSSLHKSLLHSTFLREISAEIHLAVRKQLLFVKGGGWCSFNFKDVLNELPLCDWWAVRNVPPVPLYPTTEGFNYEPLVLMLSAPVWYASCTVCVENGFYHLVASTVAYQCFCFPCIHSSVKVNVIVIDDQLCMNWPAI